MPAAQNARRQYGYVPEVTYGVTPATKPKLFEITDFDLEQNSEHASLEPGPSVPRDRSKIAHLSKCGYLVQHVLRRRKMPSGTVYKSTTYESRTVLMQTLDNEWTSSKSVVGSYDVYAVFILAKVTFEIPCNCVCKIAMQLGANYLLAFNFIPFRLLASDLK